MFTLGEIIDLAIQIEKNGENTYRKAQNEVPSSELASMLEGLADDEAEHEKWFAKLREDMDVEIEDPKLEEMGKSILRSVLGDQAFSMSDADFSSGRNHRKRGNLTVNEFLNCFKLQSGQGGL